MAIIKYSIHDFPEKALAENRQSRFSDPWDTTPVGTGFEVPFCDLKSAKTIPNPPDSIKKRGIVWERAKLKSSYLFKRIS